LRCFKDDKELVAGDPFNEKIREGLNDCREICLLISPRSLSSEYVTTEWGAAWFMKKTIVTLYLDMDKSEVLEKDKRLSDYQIERYEESFINDYCAQVLQRRLEYYLNTDEFEYYN